MADPGTADWLQERVRRGDQWPESPTVLLSDALAALEAREQRTVAEIVKELREADFEHEGISRARAWFDAADLIEQRFGVKRGEA